ncbi:MAG: hypothetical protein A2666_01260 [Parcubacteria group bacterium RIFCSPHIGHO2_01_FULL_47_10b]|nr:MAG: hypothetical protein A2666_01260 [Parcubacteria group bacterium RIFCSPHIGHO2_01_FULL_47_10b]
MTPIHPLIRVGTACLIFFFLFPLIAGSSQIESPRGWDSSATLRRIATIYPQTETFFESCPDSPTKQCFGALEKQGGFYTLALEAGTGQQPCKVNSTSTFSVRGFTEQCPFTFSWVGGGDSTPMSAQVGIDNRTWNNPVTSNIYTGLQHNVPQGSIYFGGNNFPLLRSAKTTLTAIADWDRNDSSDPYAKSRFFAGISWFVPELQWGATVQLNLDHVIASNGTGENRWRASCPEKNGIARNELQGNEQQIYLCARDWGLPSIIDTPHQLEVNWFDIITELIKRGILSEEQAPNVITGFLAGPEQLGRMSNYMTISNLHFFDISYINDVPAAVIESIAPNPGTVGFDVRFTGSGSDQDGEVTSYEWSLDGQVLSNLSAFGKSDIGVGDHLIALRVQGKQGLWSPVVTQSFVITQNNKSPDNNGGGGTNGGNGDGGGDGVRDGDRNINPPIESRKAVRLIRARGDAKVYRINGQRRQWIPSAELFTSSGYRWEDIETVDDTTLKSFERVSLLRVSGLPEVHYLTESGRIRHIPTPEIFGSYGNKWNDIIEISAGELSIYRKSKLIRAESASRVYLLDEGRKHWITTTDSFVKRGYHWDEVAPVNNTEISWYIESEPLT